MKKTLTKLSMLGVGLLLVGASCSNQSMQVPNTNQSGNQDVVPNGQVVTPGDQSEIKLANDSKLGEFFTDGKGMTLYIFNKDFSTTSACVGQCLVNWPVFYGGDNLVIPNSLSRVDFGETTTPDGQKITTYQGWPLYYYVGDRNVGDVNGENVGGVWFVAKRNYALQFTVDNKGSYIVDGKGRTLYLFTNDSKDKSTCAGQCLVNWPPFYSEDLVIPSIWNKSDFGETKTPDGQEITTFRGWPLYYYINDKVRGDMTGQNIGGVWFTIDPGKQAAAK